MQVNDYRSEMSLEVSVANKFNLRQMKLKFRQGKSKIRHAVESDARHGNCVVIVNLSVTLVSPVKSKVRQTKCKAEQRV